MKCLKSYLRHLSQMAIIFLVLDIGIAIAAPGIHDFTHQPLKGIKTIVLDISGVDNDIRRYGISTDMLRKSITERLDLAGLQVISADDLNISSDAAIISLKLNLMRAPYYFYLYGLNVTVKNKLILSQENNVYTTVDTWSDGKVGLKKPMELNDLNQYSLDLIDNFIKDYRLQNKI